MEIKERILQKAMELFMRYGIRAITMDEIARTMGISKKTIYQYFADKDEIVYETCLNHVAQECMTWEKLSHAQNALEEAHIIMEMMIEDMQDTNPAVVYELNRYHPRAYALIEQMKEHTIKPNILAHLKRGVAEGYFRDDINVELMTNFRTSIFELGLNPAVFPPAKYKLIDIFNALNEHFVRGILTDKGRILWDEYKSYPTKN